MPGVSLTLFALRGAQAHRLALPENFDATALTSRRPDNIT